MQTEQPAEKAKFHQKIVIYNANNQWILISFAVLYLIVLATEILPELSKLEDTNGAVPIILMILLVPLGIIITRPGMRGKKKLPEITLDEDSLRCPVKIGSRRYIRIPYGEITALDSRGNGKGAFHILRAKDRCLQFPAECFESKEDWQLLMNTLIDRISLLRGGQEKLNLFLQQNRLAHSIFNNKPIFTIALLCVLASVFFLQSFSKSLDYHNLAGWGANSAELIANGEFFRLFSASFLHAGIVHFCINFIALLSLGYIVEGCLGARRTALIYFFAVLVGSLFSAIGGVSLSVGASAGIFGLLAALAVINLRFHQLLPAGVSMPLRWWIIVTAVNLLLPVIFPMIDQAAHTGGLLAGGLIAWLLLREEELGYHPNVAKVWERRILAALSIFMISALGFSNEYWTSSAKRLESNLNASKFFLENKKNSAAALNNFAQNIVHEKTLQPDFLPLAESALLEAIKRNPQKRFKLTLAQLKAKQGKFEQALVLLTTIVMNSTTASGLRAFALSEITQILASKKLPQSKFKKFISKKGELEFKQMQTTAASNLLLFTDQANKELIALAVVANPAQASNIKIQQAPCIELASSAKLSAAYSINNIKLPQDAPSWPEKCFQLNKLKK